MALLWTGSIEEELESKGGLVEYVSGQFNWCNSFWYPLLLGLAFVLVLPIAKALLQMFNAFVNREGMKRVLSIKREGEISVKSYLRVREDYRKRTEELLRIVKEDTSSYEERKKLDDQVLSLSRENETVRKDFQHVDMLFKKTLDRRLLNGWWRNDYVDNQGRKGVEYFRLDDGKYVTAEMTGGGPKSIEHKFDVVGVAYDPTSRRISFVKELTDAQKVKRPPQEHFNFNSLTFNKEETVMSGTENGTVTITYTRFDP